MISESRIDIQFFVISVCGSELGYLWEKKRAAMVQVFLFWGQASRICLGKVHGKSWSRLDVQSILQATHFSPSLFLASSSPKKKLESNQQKKNINKHTTKKTKKSNPGLQLLKTMNQTNQATKKSNHQGMLKWLRLGGSGWFFATHWPHLGESLSRLCGLL